MFLYKICLKWTAEAFCFCEKATCIFPETLNTTMNFILCFVITIEILKTKEHFFSKKIYSYN